MSINVNNDMPEIIFGIALVSATTIVILSSLKLVSQTFEFWPPPSPSSWQSRTFRTLFRIFFFSLVALSIVDFDGMQATWLYVVGGSLLLLGFGFALRWTNFLGWGNAFGSTDGLKTEGIYRFSRNPIYVITILGMIGWATFVGSWMVTSLLVVWACLYIIAPFLEEPWMRKQYGEAFDDYMLQVPRYGSAGAITKYFIERLELKIPPAVIIVVCAGLMYACAIAIPQNDVMPIEARLVLAVFALIVAAVVLAVALMTFRRHQTTMNPLNPNNTTNLVTTGIYAYSRNPMYLSMFFVLLGWGFYLGHLSTAFGIALYFVAITRLQILPEEKILERKFGSDYTEFLSSSRRWLGFR